MWWPLPNFSCSMSYFSSFWSLYFCHSTSIFLSLRMCQALWSLGLCAGPSLCLGDTFTFLFILLSPPHYSYLDQNVTDSGHFFLTSRYLGQEFNKQLLDGWLNDSLLTGLPSSRVLPSNLFFPLPIEWSPNRRIEGPAPFKSHLS